MWMSGGLPARGIVVVMLAIITSSSSAEDRLVYRRSGLDPWRIERAAATPDELVVGIIDRGIPRDERIAWDRVAGVDADAEGRLEVGVEAGLRLGDRIWRGVRRLQRGDARLAARAFSEALAMGPRMPGPLAAAALEGAVRSGIATGDVTSVLVEAEVLGELSLAGLVSDRFAGPTFDHATIDETTGLVPEVPPVAAVIDSLELRRRMREMPILHDSSELRRDLWVRLLERSGPPEVSVADLDRGTRLLLELSRLDAEDPKTRENARRTLMRDLDRMPAWRVAWVCWFAGSAAITRAGDDSDATLLGVLDLMHVLALEDAAPPLLRIAALRLAAQTLAKVGRADEAAVLDSILALEGPDTFATESTP
jgi:hypothetical protein